MSYCLAIATETGLVFCTDSQSTAGVERLSTYGKMFHYGQDSRGQERQLMLIPSGNLATTQAVIAQVKHDLDNKANNLKTLTNIGDVACYLGELSRAEQNKGPSEPTRANAQFIVGGQVGPERPQLAMVYPEGHYTISCKQTPYLQMGTSQYGKPILERILTPQTPLETAARCALVSMDSSMRSDALIGPPIDLVLYVNNSFAVQHFHFDEDDAYLQELSRAWDSRLLAAFDQLPPLSWQHQAHDVQD